MGLRQWDLAWAGLDPAAGHEQSGRRPVLVFCNDAIAGPIRLATVLPLTTWTVGRRVYPTEIRLPSGTGGLPSDALVLVHQVRTIASRRLSPPFGTLEETPLRKQIATALRTWLDLSNA